jgi:hypothetical protein
MSLTKCCGAETIDGLPPRGERRCTGCGHRVESVYGARPVQSRRLPFWTWPGELLGRWIAVLANGG